jgi:hypothetical protein
MQSINYHVFRTCGVTRLQIIGQSSIRTSTEDPFAHQVPGHDVSVRSQCCPEDQISLIFIRGCDSHEHFTRSHLHSPSARIHTILSHWSDNADWSQVNTSQP